MARPPADGGKKPGRSPSPAVPGGGITVASGKLIDRYGYIHRILYSPDARSLAKLREEGRQWLAAIARPHKTINIQHPGIPRLKRGDGFKMLLPEGKLRTLYITEAHYSLNAGAFDMNLVLSYDDPFVTDITDKLTETAVARARTGTTKKRKKHKLPKGHPKTQAPPPISTPPPGAAIGALPTG